MVLTSDIMNVELLPALLLVQSRLNDLCCVCKVKKKIKCHWASSAKVE